MFSRRRRTGDGRVCGGAVLALLLAMGCLLGGCRKAEAPQEAKPATPAEAAPQVGVVDTPAPAESATPTAEAKPEEPPAAEPAQPTESEPEPAGTEPEPAPAAAQPEPAPAVAVQPPVEPKPLGRPISSDDPADVPFPDFIGDEWLSQPGDASETYRELIMGFVTYSAGQGGSAMDLAAFEKGIIETARLHDCPPERIGLIINAHPIKFEEALRALLEEGAEKHGEAFRVRGNEAMAVLGWRVMQIKASLILAGRGKAIMAEAMKNLKELYTQAGDTERAEQIDVYLEQVEAAIQVRIEKSKEGGSSRPTGEVGDPKQRRGEPLIHPEGGKSPPTP